ncbi:hypothetical protein LVY72_23400 [Arthrobacter sp. I2-34]|uniref:Uncharacterized protein n=1 Tax=Arthrobacter hankyongi TaxID=2904801 RepID=A0ABS9LDW5_9MICC|nr:hypothetical protein [Arthrobacter hankyongi]MCG2624840.1 hypothetical protein [Arthrobacter hankyongi]
MNGADERVATGTVYQASAESNSKEPHDWGRAMAAATSALATQLSLAGSSHAALFGEDLRLTVTETTDGVAITLTWTPGGSPE